MKKYIITLCTIAVFAAPLSVSAVSLADLNIRIAELLAQVFNLKAQLTRLGPDATDTVTTPSEPRDLSCLVLNRDMAEGDSGFDVTELQLFLARDSFIYPEASITGYFGRETMRAVQRFQVSRGIIAYGTPSTTGYGVVGPRTRAEMQKTCPIEEEATTTSTSTDPDVLLVPIEATPIAGGTPFDSVLTFTLSDTCVSFYLDFGDGTAPYSHDVRDVDCDGKEQYVNINHVYPRSGVYTAVLRAGKVVNSTQFSLALPTVSYAAIVAGGTLQPFSLSPTDGPAPLAVEATFTLTHPSCTSYLIDWGDGNRDEFSASSFACSKNVVTRKLKHIYSNSGNYEVSFRKGQASISNLPISERWLVTVDPIGVGKTIVELSETAGRPPLTVTLKMAGTDGYCTSYNVDWGDGSSPLRREWRPRERSEFSADEFITDTEIEVDGGEDCSGAFNRTFTHTYVTYGVYPLKIKLGKGSLEDIEVIQHWVSVFAR